MAPLLSIKEAADYLRLPKRTLDLWREKGKDRGPRFYRLGKQVRYRVEDLDAWLKARAVEPKGF